MSQTKDESRPTNEWVMTHKWMSHDLHMIKSCPTYKKHTKNICDVQIPLYAGHDVFIYETLNLHMWDVTHSTNAQRPWRAITFIRGTWRIYIWDMNSYMWELTHSTYAQRPWRAAFSNQNIPKRRPHGRGGLPAINLPLTKTILLLTYSHVHMFTCSHIHIFTYSHILFDRSHTQKETNIQEFLTHVRDVQDAFVFFDMSHVQKETNTQTPFIRVCDVQYVMASFWRVSRTKRNG